jgi:hypothetical protein
MAEMHKCKDCGYLSAVNLEDESLEELSTVYRTIGMDRCSDYWAELECFRTAERFPTLPAGSLPAKIEELKPCKRFFPYHRGKTPAEHQDMELLEQNRQWQERQASKNFHVNLVLVLASVVAAVAAVVAAAAAWWSAIHPIITPGSQSAVAQQPAAPTPVPATKPVPKTPSHLPVPK